MDMTKFEDVEDPGFIAVTGELRRWIKNIAQSSSRQALRGGEDFQRGTFDHRVPRVIQGGSHFGPTTVSGGSLFQGNFVG